MAFPGGRLSVGSISKIYAGNFSDPVVLQVLEVKKMVSNNKAASTGDRFRLILSDSEHLIPAMLTTQLNELAINGTIQQRGVIKMTDYICNPLPAKNGAASKIIVIVELEAVSDALQVQIGSPVDIGGAMSQTAVTPQVAAPAPAAAAYVPNTHHQQQQHQQPAQPIVDQSTGQVITPVRNLDMYNPRWTIRVRCTTKSQPKEYTSGNGGRLFSVTFVDETGEIRATMFNDAVDKFFPIITEGGMYVISQGKVKFANKKFTSVKHAYELTLNADSHVIPVESVDSVPRIRFDFTPIDHIQEAKKDDMLDIIAVIVSSKPVTQVNTRKGETSRRNIVVADNSGRSIELTLWGDQADGFEGMLEQHGPHTVLAFKGVRVSDFGGRTLSAMQTTEFEVEPDLEDAHAVRRWWSTVPDEGRHLPSLSSGGGGGGAGSAAGGSREKTLSSIVNENMGLTSQDYLTVPNVYVTNFTKRDGTMWYKACTTPDCKGRKVYEEGGNLKCQKCNGVNAYHLRWVCNFVAFDHTAREFISGFGDAGVTLLGCEAEVMEQHQSGGRGDLMTQIFEDGRYKSYNMRLAVKQDEYNGVMRNKVSVQSLTPIDYVVDSERLLARIAELQRP